MHNLNFMSMLFQYKTNLNRQKKLTQKKPYIQHIYIYIYIYTFLHFFTIYCVIVTTHCAMFFTGQLHIETSRHPITHTCWSSYVSIKTSKFSTAPTLKRKIIVCHSYNENKAENNNCSYVAEELFAICDMLHER